MKIKSFLIIGLCFFGFLGLLGCEDIKDSNANVDKATQQETAITGDKVNQILAIINKKDKKNKFTLKSARNLKETYPNGVVNREVYKIMDNNGITYVVKFLEDGRLFEIQSKLTTNSLKETENILSDQKEFINNFVLACDIFSENGKLFDSSQIKAMSEKSLKDLDKKILKDKDAKYTSFASTPERINENSDYFYIFSFLVDKTSFMVQIDVDLVK